MQEVSLQVIVQMKNFKYAIKIFSESIVYKAT